MLRIRYAQSIDLLLTVLTLFSRCSSVSILVFQTMNRLLHGRQSRHTMTFLLFPSSASASRTTQVFLASLFCTHSHTCDGPRHRRLSFHFQYKRNLPRVVHSPDRTPVLITTDRSDNESSTRSKVTMSCTSISVDTRSASGPFQYPCFV